MSNLFLPSHNEAKNIIMSNFHTPIFSRIFIPSKIESLIIITLLNQFPNYKSSFSLFFFYKTYFFWSGSKQVLGKKSWNIKNTLLNFWVVTQYNIVVKNSFGQIKTNNFCKTNRWKFMIRSFFFGWIPWTRYISWKWKSKN